MMLKRISILFFLGTTLSHLGAMNLGGDSYLERTIAGDARRVKLELRVAEYRDLLCSLDRRIEEIEEEETRAGLVADRPTLVAAYQQAEEDLRQHTTIISRSAPPLSKEDQVKKSLLLQIAMVNRRCKELSKALQLKVREMNQLGKQAINPTVLTLIAQEEEECAELATELKKEESHLKNLKDALRAQ